MKFIHPFLLALPLSLVLTVLSEEPSGFEKWEKSIAAFEERDRKTPPPKNCLLFVGSSSIRMWNLERHWPERPAINNGFGGSTLADSIHFFDRIIAPYQPAAVILYAGDNDIKKGLTAEETLRDYRNLSDRIHEKFPDTHILFVAIKPSRARWNLWPEMKKANGLIAEVCAGRETMTFVDIAAPMLKDSEGPPAQEWFVEDGLHLSPFGYEVWAAEVDRALAVK